MQRVQTEPLPVPFVVLASRYWSIHLQHVVSQHAVGFTARTNPLMTFPSTCGAIASTSTPAADKNSRASFAPYTLVGSTLICSNPAAFSFSRYSFSSSAPATHPTHSNTLS